MFQFHSQQILQIQIGSIVQQPAASEPPTIPFQQHNAHLGFHASTAYAFTYASDHYINAQQVKILLTFCFFFRNFSIIRIRYGKFKILKN